MPIKIHKGDEKWPLSAVLVVRVNNINNNSDVLIYRRFAIFLPSYFTIYLSWPDWLYFYSFFGFEYFDHYAVWWFPIKATVSQVVIQVKVH